MTLDKRLDQIEAVLADVAQKTARLIESNGQILVIASRADANAQLTDRGIANLTIGMRQRFDQVDHRFVRVDERFDQQQNQLDQRFEQVDERFNQQQNQIDELRTEMREGFWQVNQKFEQLSKTQQQILTLLLDRFQ